MSQINRERVDRELGRLSNRLKPFIVIQMRRLYGPSWQSEAGKPLRNPYYKENGELNLDDESTLLQILRSQWERIFHQPLRPAERRTIHELITIRNTWAHRRGVITDTDVERSLNNVEHLLSSIGDQLEQLLEVTIEEVYTGGKREIALLTCPICGRRGLDASELCSHCREEGILPRSKRFQVTIPAGVRDGSRIRLAGEGQPGIGGGPCGDLFLLIYVQPHPLFKREGDDLSTEVQIDQETACQGGEAIVPRPGGSRVLLTIPPQTPNNRTFRLKNLGVPHLQGEGRGDLYVRVKMRTT